MVERRNIHIADSPIAKVARRLVNLKFDIDTEAKLSPDNIPDDLHGPAQGGEYGPHFGSEFLSNILPFMPRDFSSEQQTVMNVPTSYIFGCSWRIWPNPDILDEEKKEAIAYIHSDSGINDAFYTYIPELSLFFAGEGKNRVNFCRFHNIEYIPARVMVTHYPDTDRIKIYVLNVASGLDVWAALDDRYIQKVSHYAYALPVFRAYGIAIFNQWPEEFPSLTEVLQYEHCCSEELGYKYRTIDADAVQEKLDKVERDNIFKLQWVRCNLLELDFSLSNIFMILLFTMITWITSLIVWQSTSVEYLNTVAGTLFTFTSGILFVVFVPVFKCRRKHLRQKLNR